MRRSWQTLGVALILTATGCSTTNVSKLVQALAKDPAIVNVNVSSVYGTLKFTRIGSTTNAVSIAPDGTVSVK